MSRSDYQDAREAGSYMSGFRKGYAVGQGDMARDAKRAENAWFGLGFVYGGIIASVLSALVMRLFA